MSEQQTVGRHRTVLVVVAIAVVVLAGVAVWLGTRGEDSGEPARVKDGVKAPNSKCRDDIQDLSNPWIRNGWWAGRVDGKPKEMTSREAMAMSMAGHKMQGVWLCPPK